MFLNLAGHAISFYLDATGRKGLQRLANKCNFFGMLWVLWLIVFARLHVRQCELVDSTGTGVLVAFLAIGTVSFYVSVFVAYRSALKESLLPTRFLPTAIVHLLSFKGNPDTLRASRQQPLGQDQLLRLPSLKGLAQGAIFFKQLWLLSQP
eukprot:symbB.v1.2.034017.t1/scaffold4315.1/size41422/2